MSTKPNHFIYIVLAEYFSDRENLQLDYWERGSGRGFYFPPEDAINLVRWAAGVTNQSVCLCSPLEADMATDRWIILYIHVHVPAVRPLPCPSLDLYIM